MFGVVHQDEGKNFDIALTVPLMVVVVRNTSSPFQGLPTDVLRNVHSTSLGLETATTAW